MGLREEIAQYQDADGFVTPRIGVGSNNGILYTSEYYVLLVKLGLARHDDLYAFEQTMRKCQIEPGLFKRHPGASDQEGPDDYIGLTTAAYLLGSDIAKEVLDYGKRHAFLYNNEMPGSVEHTDDRPNYSAMFGRSPSLIAHLYFAAGETPSFPLRLCWAVSVAYSAFRPSSDQDSHILSSLLVSAMGDKSGLCAHAARLRPSESKMRQIVGDYFSDPHHPLARHWKE